MKKSIAALIFFTANFCYAQSQLQTCNCPPLQFGYTTAKKADTVFHLSNGESIALCGGRDTINGTAFYNEFVLAGCGGQHIIKFWGAVLDCQLHVHQDTLVVETFDSLPTGNNARYKWTVWTIERIYFKYGEVKKDFNVNRQIPKYSAQQIRTALREYEQALQIPPPADSRDNVNNVNMEIADRLFISAISGSKQARIYLTGFNKHFGGLDGEYLEWYDDLMRKLKEWDTNKSSDEHYE